MRTEEKLALDLSNLMIPVLMKTEREHWGLVNSLITVSVIGYCSLLYVMQPPFRAVNLRQIKETRRQNKSFLLFCLIMMSAVSTNPIVLLCALKIKRSREHWQAVDCGDEAGEYLRWKP